MFCDIVIETNPIPDQVEQLQSRLDDDSIVNAEERKALKRALESKESWKTKAQERKKQIKLLELRIRDLEKSRSLWKEKCYRERKELKPGNTAKKKRMTKRQAKADRKKN